MHLLLYEHSLTGHRGAYALAISTAATLRCWGVSLAVPEGATSHPMFGVLSTQIENVFLTRHAARPWTGGSKFRLLASHFEQRRAAARSLKAISGRFDFIYTSNLGDMDKAILLLGPPSQKRPMGGMCMRARFHMPFAEGRASRRAPSIVLGELQLRRLASVSGVTTADPALFEYCRNSGGALQKVRYVPEIGMDPPSVSRSDARRALGIDPAERIILVYGALTQKKALDRLVPIVLSLPASLRVGVLAVGKPNAWMERYLAAGEARQAIGLGLLRIHPVFADHSLEELAFASADAVWVAYNDAGSMSGVFCQAMCSHLPVVAPDHGILRWLTLRHDVGICVDPKTRDATREAILNLFSAETALARFRAKTQEPAEHHNPRAFGDAVCEAIQSWLK